MVHPSCMPNFVGMKRKYVHLFFDLDHTLWDFDANARHTLEHLFTELKLEEKGIHDFERFYQNYLVHNERLWERYRKGYVKQEELRVKRMWLSLLDFKIADEALAQTMNVEFLKLLPTRNRVFPHSIELLNYLRDKQYQLHLITNGFEEVQHMKLHHSGLAPYFGEVITSEGSQSLKPNKEIFDYAFHKTGADPSQSIMIGDTPEVDIQGGINAGMDQVFVNYKKITTPIRATYEVHSLKDLENIF